MTGFVSLILSSLLKLGLGGVVEQVVDRLDQHAASSGRSEQQRAQATAEIAKEVVREARHLTELNARKMSFPWFGVFSAMFVVPLGLWWSAVIIDSIPYLNRLFGDESVANLPTPQMQQWAGRMIEWLFYVGTGVSVLKTLRR